MLEPSEDEIRDWAKSVTQLVIDKLGGLRDRPAYRSNLVTRDSESLDSTLPIKGTDFDSLLKVFRDTIIVPFSRPDTESQDVWLCPITRESAWSTRQSVLLRR